MGDDERATGLTESILAVNAVLRARVAKLEEALRGMLAITERGLMNGDYIDRAREALKEGEP